MRTDMAQTSENEQDEAEEEDRAHRNATGVDPPAPPLFLVVSTSPPLEGRRTQRGLARAGQADSRQSERRQYHRQMDFEQRLSAVILFLFGDVPPCTCSESTDSSVELIAEGPCSTRVGSRTRSLLTTHSSFSGDKDNHRVAITP
jgi:hypothetical protein